MVPIYPTVTFDTAQNLSMVAGSAASVQSTNPLNSNNTSYAISHVLYNL